MHATSTARIATTNASRYAGQLCKHAAHMGPRVEWASPEGKLEFPDGIGTCRVTAEPDRLVIVLESADPANLAKMQTIVGRNIERLGFRERIKVQWDAP